ncbi:acyl-CoA synthetase [Nocardia africana]|nr:long-chain fatty acid--CoA ligase [Nocardia africana]MCC3313617.1 long-chain fatty acid--CoA ligase [Nocardia africana]
MDNGIGNWPSMRARRNAGRTALIDGDTGRVYAFGEFESRTNALADVLRAKGIAAGERVALVSLNSTHMLEVLFAVAKLGAVTVPVNFRLTAAEIRYILDDSGASIVFCSSGLTATVEQADGATVREVIELPSAADRSRTTDSHYEQLLAGGDTTRVEVAVEGADLCAIMYTSGTTGVPKGAMLTHANMVWNAVHYITVDTGLRPDDIALTAAPMFHIGGLGVYTLPLFYLGGTTVIMESFAAGPWLDLLDRYRPTAAFCVPAMWAAIEAAADNPVRDLTSLRATFSGGAPCPVVLIEALRRRGLYLTEGFGLTETAPLTTYLDADEVAEHAGSVGKPVNHVRLRIVDDHNQDVAPGQVGELLIRGPNVFAGYWHKPEATAAALREGWFYSGDLARCDEDGYYEIVDRKKDMVITGGENVYPAEVEQVLYRHPAVAEATVIGTPDPKWGEAVTAVIVRKPGHPVEAADLITWTRERLAHFKCPRVVEFVEALPRNATGKVLKRELRARWVEGGAAVTR